jgi:hypothetical protein
MKNLYHGQVYETLEKDINNIEVKCIGSFCLIQNLYLKYFFFLANQAVDSMKLIDNNKKFAKDIENEKLILKGEIF